MPNNIYVFNAAIRHQIYLQRYAGGAANKLKKDLIDIKKTVVSELKNSSLSELSKKDRALMLAKLDKVINKKFGATEKEIMKAMAGLAEYESGFFKRLIDANINTPLADIPKRKLKESVFAKAFDFSATEKMTIGEAVSAFGEIKKKQLLQTVRDGFTNGDSIPLIAKNINEIVLTKQLYQATALARTLVQQVAVHARQELYTTNDDVIEKVRWVSVLDGSTTPECQALDGEIMELDSSIQPGFHWGCRSTTVPIINPKYNIIPNVTMERAARDEDGKTYSVDGRTTYNSWLQTQSPEFQDEVLGQTKGELFRTGDVNLKSFVDENYRPYTLDELRGSDDADLQKAFNKIDNNKSEK